MNHVIDFDNPAESRLMLDHLRSLRGKHRVEVVRYRPRRTDRQNAAYWPCIVIPLSEWMTQEYGERFDPDDAHDLLKRTFLTRKVTHPKTGKVMSIVGSSAALDTAQFTEYLEKCCRLLAEYCGITVEIGR